MKFSEDITELAKALAKAQNSLKNPNNTANNPFFKSKYAPLPDVLNDIRPILAGNGISVIQSPVANEAGGVGVETMLLHESGQYLLTDPYFLKPVKNDPQTAGAAITYARRYALNAALGISGEEDDDGNIANGKVKLNPQYAEGVKNVHASAAGSNEKKDVFCPICGKSVKGGPKKDGSMSTPEEVIQRLNMCYDCYKNNKGQKEELPQNA